MSKPASSIGPIYVHPEITDGRRLVNPVNEKVPVWLRGASETARIDIGSASYNFTPPVLCTALAITSELDNLHKKTNCIDA